MLEFVVDGQLLRRKDAGRIVADGVEFVKFRASFSKEWEGYTKTFLFKGADGESYCVFAVEEGKEYAVPHEVLRADCAVELSVFGSSRLTNFATANSVILYVEKSPLLSDFKQSVPPSPDLYAQLCHKLEEVLTQLPGKRPELRLTEEGICWRVQEEGQWRLLVPLHQLQGRDGALWYTGDRSPDAIKGKDGDFYFWQGKGSVYNKSGGEWTLCFDPESLLLPLVLQSQEAAQRAADAQRSAERAAEESRQGARLVQEQLSFANLYPEAFTLWNDSGPLSGPAVGEPLVCCVMEPEATYRIPVTPGKTYRFTKTPAGTPLNCYFAVGDGEGICLDYSPEPLEEYTVRASYGGRIPTHIYYSVKDVEQTQLSFCEVSLPELFVRVQAVERFAADYAKAPKASVTASTAVLRDVSDVEHSLKLRYEGEEPLAQRVLVTGKNLLDPAVLKATGAVERADGSLYWERCSTEHTVIYQGDGVQRELTLSYRVMTANADGYSGQRFRVFYQNDPQIYSIGAICSPLGYTAVEAKTSKGKTVERIELDYGRESNSTGFLELQLELGGEKTPYEPYCGASYCPAADGTVADAKAIAPLTVVRSESGAGMIQAEYQLDLNAAYHSLLGRLEALEA